MHFSCLKADYYFSDTKLTAMYTISAINLRQAIIEQLINIYTSSQVFLVKYNFGSFEADKLINMVCYLFYTEITY